MVTNFHVIESLSENRYLHLETRYGEELQFKRIRHLSFYPDDLAVLEVTGGGENFLKLGPIPNNEFYVFGFPSGQFRKIRGENIKRDGKGYYFLIDFRENIAGLSGSPMLNKQGRVFGIFKNQVFDLSIGSFLYGTPVDALVRLLKTEFLPLKNPQDLIEEQKTPDFQKPAEQGDAEAQYQMGKFFIEEKNYVEAETWFSKASEQNHLKAREELENLKSQRSVLTASDSKKAEIIKEFEQSLERARQGHAKSQYYVAEVFLGSFDLNEYIDHKKARKWFTRAAKQEQYTCSVQTGTYAFFRMGRRTELPRSS